MFQSLKLLILATLGISAHAQAADTVEQQAIPMTPEMQKFIDGSKVHLFPEEGKVYFVPKIGTELQTYKVEIFFVKPPESTLIDLDGVPAYLKNYDVIQAVGNGTDPTLIC